MTPAQRKSAAALTPGASHEEPEQRRSEVEAFASNSTKRKPIAPDRSIWWVLDAIQEVFARDLAGESETSESETSAAVCKLVALNLCAHARRDTHQAWPSVSTIATETALTRRSVQEALRKLERLGIVDRVPEGWQHRTATYRLRLGERRRIDDACLERHEKPCSHEVQDAPPESGVRLRVDTLTTGVGFSRKSEVPPGEVRTPSGLVDQEIAVGAGPNGSIHSDGAAHPATARTPQPFERAGAAPSAPALPPQVRASAARLGPAPNSDRAEEPGPPAARERGGGAGSQLGADPAPTLPLALRLATLHDAYEHAREKRWGVGTYIDAPRAWELMARVAERVASRTGCPFSRAARLVAWAYMQENGRADGELLNQKHPPEWLASYAASVESRAVYRVQDEYERLGIELSAEPHARAAA